MEKGRKKEKGWGGREMSNEGGSIPKSDKTKILGCKLNRNV